MMSEKRFATKVNKKGHLQIIDREQHIYIRDSYKCVEIMNEQQATISALKEENEQLRQQLQDWDDMVELATKTSLRNVELDEQIGQLRKELNDCEKFRYTVFKRIGELNDE